METGLRHYQLEKQVPVQVDPDQDGEWTPAYTWKAIHQASPQGQGRTYRVRDPHFRGEGVYRLVMVDYDGQIATSKAMIVSEQNPHENMLVYPTVGSGQFQLSWSAEKDGQLAVLVMDATGRLVHQQNIYEYKGGNASDLDLSYLPAGHYVLCSKARNWQRNTRLVITN